MTPPDTTDEWRQVLATYGRPGVAPACLLLQDSLDVDVLVMLHLGYVCRQHGLALPEGPIEAADALVRAWRDEVVRPLRAARRSIDKGDPKTQALRASIQQVELAAERHGFDLLAGLPLWAATARPMADGGTASRVAVFYARRTGRTAELQRAEIQHALQLLDRVLSGA